MDARQREQLQLAMAALARGDRSAFHPVFATLWPLLHRFSQRMLQDHDLAQDAAQTALLKLLLHATDFRPDRDVVAWALGFASFECLSARNRGARRREEREGPILATLAAEHPSPEEAIVDADLRAAAAEVLGTLRPQDVETINLALDGPRQATSPGFRKRLQRALERLRVAWRQTHVPMTEPQLERRGRWAYELGRAAWASHVLLLVLPLLLVAHLIGRPPALVFTLGGAIAVAAFTLAMLHDRYARAVLAGLLAGLPAFALPVILRSLGILRLGPADLDPCLPASFVSGILAGAFVSTRAVDEKHRRTYWLAAAAMAAAIGTLGCSVVGGAGVLGLLAGLAAGTAPAVVRGTLRRS